MKHEEDQAQAAVFQYAGYMRNLDWKMLFSIPNGGARHIATAKTMKRTGTKPGVPDMFLPVAKTIYHGLFIEMKSQKGRVTSPQKVWHAKLIDQGYCVKICRSAEDAIFTIKSYLNGTIDV